MRYPLAFACLAMPALAAGQSAADPPPTIAEVDDFILARDHCPDAVSAEEIVVCGRRPQGDRFRLPLRDQGFDPLGPAQSVSRERNALLGGQENGGLGTCTNIGPNGMTGCLNREVWRRREQYGR